MVKNAPFVYASKGMMILAGIICSLILLELLLRAWGSIRTAISQREVVAQDSFVILTLGESTTSSEYPDAWPVLLGKILQDKYPAIPFQIVNKAKTGISSGEAAGNIDEYISTYRPNVIISMIGVNDAPGDPDNTSLFAPVTPPASFKIIKLVRLLHRYTAVGIRRFMDFVALPSPDRLNKIAENLRRSGAYAEAEVYLKKSLELDKHLPETHLRLSYLYRETGRIAEAKQALLQLMAVDPAGDSVYHELGIFYRDIIHNDQLADSYFIKALEKNDRNGQIYLDYGMHVINADEILAAELFDKAMAFRPDLYWAYFYRAELYLRSGNQDEAERLYNAVLAADPGNTVARMKRTQLSAGKSGEVAGLADPGEKSLLVYPRSLQQSYSRLVAAASENSIPLIAVQYPLQPVKPLQELINKVSLPNSQVSVVANTENFKEALRNTSYKNIFVDAFGGNFGHATREGNALIAESVAAEVDATVKNFVSKQ